MMTIQWLPCLRFVKKGLSYSGSSCQFFVSLCSIPPLPTYTFTFAFYIQTKMEELQLFRGDTVLIKGKKRRDTVSWKKE